MGLLNRMLETAGYRRPSKGMLPHSSPQLGENRTDERGSKKM
jgi:hypothetical protein